jgi:thiol-disulfide isomerase/thioredoxin
MPLPYRVKQFLAALLCLAITSSAAIAAAVGEGAILGDATLQGLNGPSRKLSDFRGRPLIINVWASWCGPCREEMASLERLAWRGESRYFAIIGISTDDDADRAKALLKQVNATISQFIDKDLRMENMLGASRLPLTVLIDGNGRILEKVYGARQWDGADARQLIDEAFHRRTIDHGPLVRAIQTQVEHQNIDARFPENAPLRTLGLREDRLAQFEGIQMANPRDASHLIQRSRRRDVGIEAAG